MFSNLLRFAAPAMVAVGLLLTTTGDAHAQRRGINFNVPGISGPGGAPANVNIGPSGINVGPSYAPGTTYPNTGYPSGYNYNQSGYYGPGYYGPNGYYQNGYYRSYPPGTTYPQGTTITTTAPALAPAPTQQDRAVMNVRLPANARLFIGDNEAANQSGSNRQFVTPPLEAGHAYQYHMKAQWTENGQTVERTRDVSFQAGDRITVDFMQGS